MHNKIIVTRADKSTVYDVLDNPIKNLSVSVLGNNNVIKVAEPTNFRSSRIIIDANDSHIEIKSSRRLVCLNLNIKNGDGQSILIEEGFSAGGVTILMLEPRARVSFGRDCMLSSDITVLCGDGHSIYTDDSAQLIKNWSADITIGDHVWIGRSARLSRGCAVSNGSIVAFGALVSKKFLDANVAIGGCPAKIISKDIYWDRRAPNIFHNAKINKYNLDFLSMSESEVRAILAEEPDREWVDAQIGYMRATQQRTESDIKQAEEALQQSPQDSAWRAHLIHLYERIGEFDKAAELSASDSVSQLPDFQVKPSLDKTKDLADVFGFPPKSSGAKHDQLNFEIEKQRVSRLLLMKRYDQAKDLLKQIIERDPPSIWFQERLANIFVHEEDTVGATHALNAIIRHSPEDPSIMRQLGEFFLEKDRLDECEKAARAALDMNCNFLWAHRLLSSVFKTRGDINGAIDWVDLAAEINPDHIGFTRLKIGLLFDANRLDESKVLLRRLISKQIDAPWAARQLCRILHQTGDILGAIAAAKQSLAAEPKNSNCLRKLSELLREAGQQVAERDTLRILSTLDPANSWASSRLIELETIQHQKLQVKIDQ